MRDGQAGVILDHVCNLIGMQRVKELSDGELVQRFAGTQDEAAFTVLMQRHGPLVLHVCRRILRHEQDAEDAFQATFLVLARKAGSIRKQTAVASWLYGVAYRIARAAKTAAKRRRDRESCAVCPPVEQPSSEMAWRELQAILDEELNRLPEKYRAPFVLCCLEGMSKKEAARELGRKEGTVSSRLAQARNLLQKRLGRRGVSLSALLCGTAVAHNTAAAAMPPVLAAATIKTSLAFALSQTLGSGARTVAVELAEGFLKGMAATRLKAGAALLFLLCVAGAGLAAAVALRQPGADDQAGSAERHRPPADKDTKKRSPRPRDLAARPVTRKFRAEDAEGKMTVAGRVLDRDGQPLPGARVEVVAGEFRQAGQPSLPGPGKKVLTSGQSDDQGKFRLTLNRPSIQRHFGVSLIAAAPGHAPGWLTLSPREDYNEVRCHLETGQAVRGRLVNTRGAPARRVQVHVVGMVKREAGSSVMRFGGPLDGLHSWPASATTDDDGQFILRDVDRQCEMDLQIRDRRFAPQWLILPADTKRPELATFTLAPSRTLAGTVASADTGLPMPHARLLVMATGQGASRLPSNAQAEADEKGRFQVQPFPGKELTISAYPARGKPYLVLQKTVSWPAGKDLHEVHFTLPRGVLVRGKIVEKPAGRPVPGATVEYEPRTDDNPHARMETGAPVMAWWLQDARTDQDGTFQVPVLPGPGWLFVKGPSPDYIHTEVSARQMQAGKMGGTPYFPDALVPLDLKPGSPVQEVRAALRRGVTITGRVLGQNGRPVAAAFLLAPTYLPAETTLRSQLLPLRLPVRDGGFKLPGCDPKTSVPVLFFDAQHQEGAFVELSPKKAAGKPVRIQLAPCGSATVRCVDSAGRPLARPPAQLEILLRPGADLQDSIDRQVRACLTVPVQRLCGTPCTRVDAGTGNLTFSCLIPGATYLVRADEGNGMTRKAVIRARAGQRVALPDIVFRPSVGGRR
jgi:RNA polymerase sigma factor (sigma-70 family)